MIKVIDNDQNASVARIVIAGEWTGEHDKAKQILHTVCECQEWQKEKSVDFLMTSAGFLKFKWPQSLINSKPDEIDPKTLIEKAQEECSSFLDKKLTQILLKRTNYLLIGMDSYLNSPKVKKKQEELSKSKVKKSKSKSKLQVELAALIDLEKNQYYWTGKSYPLSGQERHLVRIEDISSHFKELSIEKL